MPVKSSDDRLYNYALKHDTEVIKKQSDARRARMLSKQQEAQVELVAIEEKAKVVLGTHGVPTCTYPSYLNFVREAWKKARKFTGQTLAKEVIVIEDKWVSRELKRPVLEELRKSTLGIPDVT
jgi:replicative DNA helicase